MIGYLVFSYGPPVAMLCVVWAVVFTARIAGARAERVIYEQRLAERLAKLPPPPVNHV